MKKIRSMYSLKVLFGVNNFCQQCKELYEHVRSARQSVRLFNSVTYIKIMRKVITS